MGGGGNFFEMGMASVFERIVPWVGEAEAPGALATRCHFCGGWSPRFSTAGSSAVEDRARVVGPWYATRLKGNVKTRGLEASPGYGWSNRYNIVHRRWRICDIVYVGTWGFLRIPTLPLATRARRSGCGRGSAECP